MTVGFTQRIPVETAEVTAVTGQGEMGMPAVAIGGIDQLETLSQLRQDRR